MGFATAQGRSLQRTAIAALETTTQSSGLSIVLKILPGYKYKKICQPNVNVFSYLKKRQGFSLHKLLSKIAPILREGIVLFTSLKAARVDVKLDQPGL